MRVPLALAALFFLIMGIGTASEPTWFSMPERIAPWALFVLCLAVGGALQERAEQKEFVRRYEKMKAISHQPSGSGG